MFYTKVEQKITPCKVNANTNFCPTPRPCRTKLANFANQTNVTFRQNAVFNPRVWNKTKLQDVSTRAHRNHILKYKESHDHIRKTCSHVSYILLLPLNICPPFTITDLPLMAHKPRQSTTSSLPPHTHRPPTHLEHTPLTTCQCRQSKCTSDTLIHSLSLTHTHRRIYIYKHAQTPKEILVFYSCALDGDLWRRGSSHTLKPENTLTRAKKQTTITTDMTHKRHARTRL